MYEDDHLLAHEKNSLVKQSLLCSCREHASLCSSRNIHTPPLEGSLEFPGGGGFYNTEKFKGMYENF